MRVVKINPQQLDNNVSGLAVAVFLTYFAIVNSKNL
jgi:hypothetical protein